MPAALQPTSHGEALLLDVVPPLSMSITDEEANAELEKLQQNITLTLQTIDKNFAKCNQIVSAELLPIIDKFGEASRGVWDGSKLWLYFFQSLENGQASVNLDDHAPSNRPPLGALSTRDGIGKGKSPWQRLNQELSIEAMSDISSITSRSKTMTTPKVTTDGHPLGRILQRQYHQHVHPTIQSAYLTSSTSLPKPTTTALSDSTNDSEMTDQRMRSPPRTLGFGPSAAKLQRTPAREAAKIMADDLLDTVGARSPPSSASQKDVETSSSKKRPAPEEDDDDDDDDLGADDEISRQRVREFLDHRENADFGGLVSLPSMREAMRSPDPRSRWREEDWRRQPMVSTPTMEHVMNHYKDDLRPLSKRQRTQAGSERGPDDDEARIDQDVTFQSFELPSTPNHEGTTKADRDQNNSEDADGQGAYEFSHTLPSHNAIRGIRGENNSVTSADTGSSMITMMSGLTGQIPARFSLHYFPSSFQTPPGSTQLTSIYTLFSERPGQMLTTQDVLDKVQDSTQFYNPDNVSLLINLLVRKQFLKQVGSGWTLRR